MSLLESRTKQIWSQYMSVCLKHYEEVSFVEVKKSRCVIWNARLKLIHSSQSESTHQDDMFKICKTIQLHDVL